MKKLILTLSLFAVFAGALYAGEVMTYQGRLKENGAPVNVNRTFAFDFCATSNGTGCVPSSDGNQPFLVMNGLFKSTFTVPAVDLTAGPWYLRVSVDGTPLYPAERLTSLPYAIFAASSAYAASALPKAGGAMTGPLSLGGFALNNVSTMNAAAVNSGAYLIAGSTVLAADAANTFVGKEAGFMNVSGTGNTAVGNQAGYRLSSGADNTFLGDGAGTYNETGGNNTAVGIWAGHFNIAGAANAIMGYYAGTAGTFSSSTIMGYSAGTNLTGGSADNVLIGYKAGYDIDTGTRNIVIGYDQDTSAPGMNNELNIGGVLYGDLSARTLGVSRKVPGAALDVVSTGTLANQYAQIWRNSAGTVVASMTATGALYAGLTVPGDNLGSHTATQQLNMVGYAIYSSSDITAARYQIAGSTVLAVLPGNGSFGAGVNAGAKNTAVGINNSFFGANSGNLNTIGTNNSYFGYMAGDSGIAGNFNSFFGAQAARYNQTGSGNVGIGFQSAGTGSGAANSFSSTTVVGAQAGFNLLATSADNILLGWRAGYNVQTGSGNIVVGYNQDTQNPSSNYQLNLGGVLFGDLLNRTVGISTRAPQAALDIVSTGTLASQYAQIWRNSAGTVVSSMTADGKLSTLQPMPGDNLGSHTAGADLKMNGYRVLNAFKVGIATGIPGKELEIVNAVNIPDIRLTRAFGGEYWDIGGNSGVYLHFLNGATPVAFFSTDGDFALGMNSAPSTARLEVGGGSVTIHGIPSDKYVLQAGDNGIVVSSGGAIQTTGVGNGTAAADPRGNGAVDLQTARTGGTKAATGEYSVIAGGYNNLASGIYNSVLSGRDNSANAASGYATVAGGGSNTASGQYSAIGGGSSNNASGNYSAIGGGSNNTASNTSVVSGGYLNKATGNISSVGGGWANTASSEQAAVAGGTNNTAGGQYSAVTGGYRNTAWGDYSAVPGGSTNTAKGAYSFAAGYLSSSTAQGAFTWTDSQGLDNLNAVQDRTVFKNRGGFLVTGSTNTNMTGALNRGLMLTGDGLLGISTGSPQAALDVVSTGTLANQYAQIWRNSAGTVVASMTATGFLNAGLVAPGDGLGGHNAVQRLNMGNFAVWSSSSITAANYQIGGSTVLAGPGTNNIFVGSHAGETNGPGTDNAYLGVYSGVNNSGVNNTVLGSQAGVGHTAEAFSDTVLVGYKAGFDLGNVSNNVLIGYLAGANIHTGGGNIIIGSNQYASGPASNSSSSNELNIGGVLFGDLAAKTIGISTRVPQAALDIVSTGTAVNIFAQKWRDGNGVIVATMTSTGQLNTTGAVSADEYQINGTRMLSLLGGTGSMGAGTTSTLNTGDHNSFIGRYTAASATGGSDNTYVGYFSGSAGNTGAMNSYLGSETGRYTKIGSGNVAFGYKAGFGVVDQSYSSNTLVGSQAGLGLTTGSENVFIGFQAGDSNTSGTNNNFVGSKAGNANLTGSGNNFMGRLAGQKSLASNNNFFGNTAGANTITGNENSYFGDNSGYSNVNGSHNAIFGNSAGFGGSGSYSSATLMGFGAGYALSDGHANTFIGYQAGYTVTTGTGNIVIGYKQDAPAVSANNQLNIGGVLFGDLAAKTIGISTRAPQAALDIVSTGTLANQYAQIWRNSAGTVVASMTATGFLNAGLVAPGDGLGGHNAVQRLNMGNFAVWSSSSITAANYQIGGSTVLALLAGGDSIGVGIGAGKVNTGTSNSFFGAKAGLANTSGAQNSFFGAQAGDANSTGMNNSFFGSFAGHLNSTGKENTFIGFQAGNSNTLGNYNSFMGVFAGLFNSTGENNTHLGYKAGEYPVSGSANTILGSEAGLGVFNSSFSSSTIVGYQAGNKLETGSDNIFIGYKAGYNVTTGTGNIVIGYNQDAPAVSANNQLNIGGVLFGDLAARTIGISTRAPQAALDIVSTGTLANHYAQIWRNSAGTIVASMTATGQLFPGGTASDSSKVPLTGGNMTGQLGVNITGSYPSGVNVSVVLPDNAITDSYGLKAQVSGNNTVFTGVWGEAYGLGTNTGLYGSAHGTAVNYGVKTSATGGTADYGLHSSATGTNSNYAVYAEAYNGSQNYAVYAANGLSYFSGFVGFNVGIPLAAVDVAGDVQATGNISAKRLIFQDGILTNSGDPRGTKAVDLQMQRADNTQVASGNYSVIGGGEANKAPGVYTTIAGGNLNNARLSYSSVGGGYNNSAWGATNGYVTIAGGANNSATGDYTFIAGGAGNTASGDYSSIAGGTGNTASGGYSFIGGGDSNVVSGEYSAVPGGFDNTAKGDYSFAAGHRSSSTAAGTFTWSDGTGSLVDNDIANQVRFKASGGFWVSTSALYNSVGLFVSTGNTVGIGTTTFAGVSLHVNRDGLPDRDTFLLGTKTDGLNFSNTGTGLNIDALGGDLLFNNNSGNSTFFYAGKVGVGAAGQEVAGTKMAIADPSPTAVGDPYVLKIGTGATPSMLTVSTMGAVAVSGDLKARVWQRIFNADITIAQTNFTIAPLSGDTDVEYKLIVRVVNSATGLCTVTLRINSDSATANYNSQWYGAITPGALTYQTSTALMGIMIGQFGSGAVAESSGLLEGTLYAKSDSNRLMYMGTSSAISATTLQQVAGTWNRNSALLNSISLNSDLSLCLGVGTHIELWAFR